MTILLPFERHIAQLEEQVARLEGRGAPSDAVHQLRREVDYHLDVFIAGLSAYQRTMICRHPERPYAQDYIDAMFTDWIELHGDRCFMDDPSIVAGLARLDGEPIVVVGQQKGRTAKEMKARNFGMPKPEGFRKGLRLMRLAERMGRPIVTFIDTPGAYPGIGAEERGQSEAIARNIMEMFSLTTPIVGVIVGEGASGGALGVGVVDYMFMLENSWYCVISPEGCASILWRDASKAPEVAEALKLDAANLLRLDVTDETVPEPRGGAHHDPRQTIENLRGPLLQQVKRLKEKDTETLLRERFEKYRKLGVMAE